MSKDPLKNWQLEEGGEPLEQWKLQDTEQELGHMRLQPTGGTTKDWQPVEYQRTPAKGGRNWILPSIVIVALLIALGYVGYVSLNRFDVGALTSGMKPLRQWRLRPPLPRQQPRRPRPNHRRRRRRRLNRRPRQR